MSAMDSAQLRMQPASKQGVEGKRDNRQLSSIAIVSSQHTAASFAEQFTHAVFPTSTARLQNQISAQAVPLLSYFAPREGDVGGSQTSSTCPTILREGRQLALHHRHSIRISPPSSVATATGHQYFNNLRAMDGSHNHIRPSWRQKRPKHPFKYQEASFRPSNAITGWANPPRNPFEEARLKARHGISAKYRGDPSLPGNQSANIPDSENCSFWIINLPSDVTHQQLLGRIRNTGRIHACVINPPDPKNQHFAAAAKVVFFDLHAAQKFLNDTFWGLMVGGHRARVSRNRIKSAAQPHATGQSRVLIIEGDPDFVNPRELTRYFDGKFQYQIDRIIDVFRSPDLAVVEYRFGSYRCQAQTARMAIQTEHMWGPGGSGRVYDLWFGHDPCDVVPGSQQRDRRFW